MSMAPANPDDLLLVEEIHCYRLNDCDWVAAASEEEAIAWYLQVTGCFREEGLEEPVIAESLSMPVFLDENRSGAPTATVGELIALRLEFPCVICSTEY